MVDAGSIWIKLGLNTEELRFGIDKAKYKLTEWRDETNKSTADMAKWGAAITANVAPVIALGTAVYAMQEKYGAMAAEITDLSTTTGLSTDKIQQLQYAALLSNTAFSNVTMGVNTLTLAISKAGDTSSDAGKAFAELGVSSSGRSVDQVFEDTTSALMGMENTTRRNEIAMTLYGRSWKEMLPFMEDYIKNKEKIQKTPTFSKQELQDLKDAKKAWDDLGNSITIYSGKALARTQADLTYLYNMNEAYHKLAGGDVKGFLSDAGKEHDRQVAIEAEKAQAIRDAGAAASTPGNFDPVAATEDLTAAVTEETDAQKELRNAIEDVASAQDRLNDINKDYAREMSILNPRDVASARNLIIRHGWGVEDQTAAIGQAQSKVSAAGGNTYGDVNVYLDKNTLLAKVPGVAAGAGERSLTQAGF